MRRARAQDTKAGAPTFHDTSGCVARAANVTARVAYATHGVARFAPANLAAPAAHSKARPRRRRPRVAAALRRTSARPPRPRRRPPPESSPSAAPAAPAANEPHRAAAAPAPARRRAAPEPNAWNAPARDRDALRDLQFRRRDSRSRFVKTFGGLTRRAGGNLGRRRAGPRAIGRPRVGSVAGSVADARAGPRRRRRRTVRTVRLSRRGRRRGVAAAAPFVAAALFVAAFARSFPGQSLGENVTSGARFIFSFAAGIVSGTSFPRGGSSAPSNRRQEAGSASKAGSGSSGGSDEATPRAAPFATPSTSATDPSRPFERRPARPVRGFRRRRASSRPGRRRGARRTRRPV